MIVLATGTLAGQPSASGEQGRVTGTVVDPDDAPLAGATIRLRDTAGTVREATTDAEGRFALAGLAAGTWSIDIEAIGFITGEGRVQVEPGAATPPLEVALRSLDEVAPSFAESAGTARSWMTLGNNLLAQGKTAEARAEYLKAVAVLPPAERPQVLQAVARTHFLEGDVDAAVDSLTEALRYDPANPELGALFRALLSELGRGAEADALIEGAAAAGPPAAEAPSRPTFQAPPQPPAGPPAAGRTGRQRVVFSESSELARLETYLERSGMTRAQLAEGDPQGGAYTIEEETISLFVPEDAEPDEPLGLLVWISPTPAGGFRNPEIGEWLSEHRLIWAGADNAGNSRHWRYRTALALDAVHNLKRLYSIDPERTYVAGYSGGGRVATTLSMAYPEVFRGGIFFFGCDFYRPIAVPDKPGMFWPARIPVPGAETLATLKRDHRFVLVTGERDFNRAETKAIYRLMRDEGFERLLYLEIPGADHYFGITREWLEKAIAVFDAPR